MNIKNRKIIGYALFMFIAAALPIISFGGFVESANAENSQTNRMTFANCSAANQGNISIIAPGLNNPRGLNFAPDGELYIAEAGSVGVGHCGPGPEGIRCLGHTGSVTRIDLRRSSVTRTAFGLPSLASEDGSFATGVRDISFQCLVFAFGTGFDNRKARRQRQTHHPIFVVFGTGRSFAAKKKEHLPV